MAWPSPGPTRGVIGTFWTQSDQWAVLVVLLLLTGTDWAAACLAIIPKLKTNCDQTQTFNFYNNTHRCRHGEQNYTEALNTFKRGEHACIGDTPS